MIDIFLLDPIKKWAEENYKTFTNNGFGRQFKILDNSCPKEVFTIKKIIVEKYKLENKQQEPIYKDFCGFITDGGAIHEHTDANKNGLIHTRFNVMISKPIEGGIPIQDGKQILVEEGDVWRCDAGLIKHSCTEVKGNKPRIVLSFGFLL